MSYTGNLILHARSRNDRTFREGKRLKRPRYLLGSYLRRPERRRGFHSALLTLSRAAISSEHSFSLRASPVDFSRWLSHLSIPKTSSRLHFFFLSFFPPSRDFLSLVLSPASALSFLFFLRPRVSVVGRNATDLLPRRNEGVRS